MAVTGSVERRLKCLQIASSQLRRTSKDESVPPAQELVVYASTLDEWALNGTGQGGMHK